MRFLAFDRVCANVHGARALGQIRYFLVPNLMLGESA